ncbi:MAG: SGNH/GDSL hydrolase family protein [Polyangiaceae bacterium]
MPSLLRRALSLATTLATTAAAFALAACGSDGKTTNEPENTSSSSAHPQESASASASSSASAQPSSSASATASAAPTTSASAEPVATAEPEPLPSGIKVLIIGDSFAEALGAGLKTKEGATGIKFILKGEKATFIPEWAGPSRGVTSLVAQYKPDLVVVALGGNELAMPTPEIRAPKVQTLVGMFKDIPCVWVSPPLWGTKETGLLEVIRKNSSPCRYYDSNILSPDLPRGGDKIHPTAAGQRKWAEYFLDWLTHERDASATKFTLKPRPGSE